MDILGLIQINDWFLLFITVCAVVYWYFTWHFGYWTSRGIPGPKPLPFLGNMYPMFKKGPQGIDPEYAKTYGKVYGTFEGRTPILSIQDPELLKLVFVKNHQDFPNRRTIDSDSITSSMLSEASGEQWRTLRTIMTPAFSTGKLKLMTSQINECAKELVENIRGEADTGNAIDLKPNAGAFTMDAIATTAFGLKINSQKDKTNPFVTMAKKTSEMSLTNPLLIIAFFFPFLLPVLKWLKIDFIPKDVKEFFTRVSNKALDARKESGETRPDFMQLMMNAHKDDEENQEDKEQEVEDKELKEIFKGVTKRSLTKDEVIAQCMLFFLAGYETTATSVSFLLYNLALNSEIQEKLYEEIIDVAGDQEITYNMLSEMNLLDMCVQESLRMYPLAARTERICANDTRIKEMDIPKGAIINIPIYAIHYDPEIWPEPEKFNPYRFMPEERLKHGSYDWLPFGAGPRGCIAMRLGLLEIKIACVYLLRAFTFIKSEKTEIPLSLGNTGLLSPANGVWLEIQKR